MSFPLQVSTGNGLGDVSKLRTKGGPRQGSLPPSPAGSWGGKGLGTRQGGAWKAHQGAGRRLRSEAAWMFFMPVMWSQEQGGPVTRCPGDPTGQPQLGARRPGRVPSEPPERGQLCGWGPSQGGAGVGSSKGREGAKEGEGARREGPGRGACRQSPQGRGCLGYSGLSGSPASTLQSCEQAEIPHTPPQPHCYSRTHSHTHTHPPSTHPHTHPPHTPRTHNY